MQAAKKIPQRDTLRAYVFVYKGQRLNVKFTAKPALLGGIPLIKIKTTSINQHGKVIIVNETELGRQLYGEDSLIERPLKFIGGDL